MNRPTFHAAIGKTSYGGSISRAFSSKDATAHTKLKYRQVGQASEEEMAQKDLKTELEKQEHAALVEKTKEKPLIPRSESGLEKPKLLKFQPEVIEEVKKKYDDADATVEDDNDSDDFESSDESDDSDNDDDSEDDEEELQRELERIKAERAASQARKEQEDKELEERLNRESALKGNPLIDLEGGNGSAKIKRRWNDDVVFRNQARDEQETKKRFINDTIRNDFHRSFLKKYVK